MTSPLSADGLGRLPLGEALLRLSAEDDPHADVRADLRWLRAAGQRLRRQLAGHTSAAGQAAVLGRYLFGELHLRADARDVKGEDLDNLLLTRVIERREGICLSFTLLALALAEEAGMDAHVVLVPNHCFVRVEGAGNPVNLETTLGDLVGGSPPDAYYRRMMETEVRFRDPEHLQSLGRKRALAAFLRQRANVYMGNKVFSKAFREAKRALALAPGSHAMLSEWAQLHAEAKRPVAEVRAAFAQAMARFPRDARLHYNLAVFEREQGDLPRSLELAQQAADLAPRYALAVELARGLEEEAARRQPAPRPFAVCYGSPLGLVQPAAHAGSPWALGAGLDHTGFDQDPWDPRAGQDPFGRARRRAAAPLAWGVRYAIFRPHGFARPGEPTRS